MTQGSFFNSHQFVSVHIRMQSTKLSLLKWRVGRTTKWAREGKTGIFRSIPGDLELQVGGYLVALMHGPYPSRGQGRPTGREEQLWHINEPGKQAVLSTQIFRCCPPHQGLMACHRIRLESHMRPSHSGGNLAYVTEEVGGKSGIKA